MENQPSFATFINNRTQSLIERVDEARRKRSGERIRRLRVGLKRWRTLYRLLAVLMPHRAKNNRVERLVHKLLKRAGKLRNFQQNRQLLPGLNLPAELEKKVDHFLKKREKKARKRLKKAINSFQAKRIRKIGRIVSHHKKAVSQDQVSQQLHRAMDHETRVIQALHQKEPSPEQLHTVRKRLKSLIELANVLITVTNDTSLSPVSRRAGQLQKQLGNWHDQIVLVEQLDEYIARHPNGFPLAKARLLLNRLETANSRRTSRVRQRVASLNQLLPLLTEAQ